MLLSTKIASVAACLMACMSLDAQITINSVTSGATVTSPLELAATITNATSASEITVSVDGIQVYSAASTFAIDTPLTMSAGSHTILVSATTGGSSTGSGSGKGKHGSSSSGTSTSSTSISVDVVSSLPAVTNIGPEVAADMTGLNEGFPQGVPLSYNWATAPFIQEGTNANGGKALESWGIVYVASQVGNGETAANPAPNTLVNIRNMQAWLLSKSTGTWTELQSTSAPQGAAYIDDYANDTNKPATIVNEPDGSIAVTAGGGYNFHFYPANRATINPNDIGGIVTLFEARLITANASQPNDMANAHFLCGAGGDYYPSLTGSWPGNTTYNPGIGGGKLKYVYPYWRFYSFTTMTAAQLTSNPPPINLTGILP